MVRNPFDRAWWHNWVEIGLPELQAWWSTEDIDGTVHLKPGQWTALRIRWAARHACRRLRAERDAARAERDELANEAMARENDDAMVCPEDWGIHEWVGALTRQRDAAHAAGVREGLVQAKCVCEEYQLPEWDRTGKDGCPRCDRLSDPTLVADDCAAAIGRLAEARARNHLWTAEACYGDDQCATCEKDMGDILKPKPSGLRWVQSLSLPTQCERWWWLERDGLTLGCAHPTLLPGSSAEYQAWLLSSRGDVRIHSGTLAECVHALVRQATRRRPKA